MKKFLPLLPLVFWIFVYPALGGFLFWLTKYPNIIYLGSISIIAIFNLVWYLLKLNYKREGVDLITTIGNLLILNLPAYLLIKWYFTRQTEPDYEKKLADYHFNYSKWELEELKAKNPKKYEKLAAKITLNEQQEATITTKEMVLQQFGVYLLTGIYQKNPDLTNTFEIISQFKLEVATSQKILENLANFQKNDLTLFFNDEQVQELGPDYKIEISEIIENSLAEEILLVFKQYRSEMQTQAKQILQLMK